MLIGNIHTGGNLGIADSYRIVIFLKKPLFIIAPGKVGVLHEANGFQFALKFTSLNLFQM